MNDTTRFSHRGHAFRTSREGMPASSNHMHMNQTKVHHRESTEVHNTLNLNQVQNNQMHVNTRDPAITLLVEQVAEARHCEALANTEQVVQTMVSEMSRWFNAEEEAASARMQQMTKLAESREGQYREELVQQGEVYKRVFRR